MTHEPHAVLATASGRSMSLKRVDARGRVAGLLLAMTVRQAYRNDTDDTLEVVYTFPLPWGAVLLGCSVELGGRRLDGTVLARPQAEARYEEAVAEGDTPIMVRKGPDGLYTVDLGNLKAGEDATIELRFAQALRIEQGRLRLALPTTIAPRYGDMAAQPGMKPQDTTAASLSADYGFGLSLDLDAASAAGGIASPSHAIDVARLEDGGARVSIAGRAWLDRDFVLELSGVAHAAGTARALRAPDGAGCVVMASFCPALDAPSQGALDLKLLVDCSGSMGGDSIASARRGLERVLAALRPADRVSFSRFGSTVRHVLDALHPADGPTLERLHREVGATDATMGGTELNDALVSTFALRGARAGSKADVLLVTDGQVADIEPIVGAARASGHRIFAVGVGSAPADSLLRQLAESTGGACELVAPGESIEGAIERTFARLRVPRVTGVSVDWGAEPAWTTKVPDALFDGDTLHVFAGFASIGTPVAPRLMFTVSTRTGRGRTRVEATAGWALPAPVSEVPTPTCLAADAAAPETHAADRDASLATVLPRMAAWQRIQDATRQGGSRRVPKAELDALRDLALAHGLVTDETNLFLVHVRAEADKADGLPTLQQTEQMLAAGWGGTGSVVFASERRVASPRMALYSLSVSEDAFAFRSLDTPAFRRSPRGVPGAASGPGDAAADGTNLGERLRQKLSVPDPTPPAAPLPRLRTTGRVTPRRLFALVRRHLHDGDDVAALRAGLGMADLPKAALEALDALRSLSPDTAAASDASDTLLVLLWALARRIGDSALPGEPAMRRLHAHLRGRMSADTLERLARDVDLRLASTGLDAW